MKVRELVAHLNNFDPEMEVHFAHHSPGRDHWLSPSIEGVAMQRIVWSFWHNCPKVTENLAEEGMSREVVVVFP